MAALIDAINALPFELLPYVENRRGLRRGALEPHFRIKTKLDQLPNIICCVCTAKLYKEESKVRRDGQINHALLNHEAVQPSTNNNGMYLACNVCSKLPVTQFPTPFVPYDDLNQLLSAGQNISIVKVITTYRRTQSVNRAMPGFLKFSDEVKLVINDALVLAIRSIAHNLNLDNVDPQQVRIAQCLMQKDHIAASLATQTGLALLAGNPLTIGDIARANLLTLWAFPHLFNNINQVPDNLAHSTFLKWIRLRTFGKCFPYRDDQVFMYYLFTEMEFRRAYRHFHYRARAPDGRALRNTDVLMNIGARVSYNELTTVPVPASFRLSASYKVAKYLDLLAVAKDFGDPTLFLTFSSNVFGWQSLADSIRETKGVHSPPNNEPVLYARYFKRRFQIFYNEYILKVFARKVGGVEWSHTVCDTGKNGLLHMHVIMRTGDSIETMIEKNIIRSSAEGASDVLFEKLHRYQQHDHGTYCLVNNRCRFDFPRQYQPRTVLEDQTLRYKMICGFDINMVNCIDGMLLCWDAQMNAQYVPRGQISQYVTKYCSKSDTALEDPAFIIAANDDTQLRTSLYVYFKNRSVHATYLTYLILGYGTDCCTRDVIYLPSNHQTYQHGILRPLHVLDELPDDSEEIFYYSKIVKYLQRPPQYHELTYPDFYRQIRVIQHNNGRTTYRERRRQVAVRSYFFPLTNSECFYEQALLWTTAPIYADNEYPPPNYLSGLHPNNRTAFLDQHQDQELVSILRTYHRLTRN